MSVWPTYAVRSVPMSMVPTSATADKATTLRRMATPVKVQHALLHIASTVFIQKVCLDKFIYQFDMIYPPCHADIDECSQSIGHLCTYKCVNIPGSYKCACPDYGYTMSPNGRSCRGEYPSTTCMRSLYCSRLRASVPHRASS